MKHKLFDYKPKYKSYKDRILNKILEKGNKLIYQCRRCRSKNIIYNETKRQTQFKIIKSHKSTTEKNLINCKQLHTVSFNNKKLVNNNISSRKSEMEINVKPKNNLTGKKKFSSLQLKLKQSELDQEKLKNEKVTSSIFDFLQNLS